MKFSSAGRGTRMLIGCFVAALLTATAGPSHAGADQFAGIWAVQHCDVDALRQPCGGFTLVLVQHGDRLCGSHFAATPNFGRVDQGAPTSVFGTAVGNDAVLFIESGRDTTSYLAKATILSDGLAWRLVEQLVDIAPLGDPVIPLEEILHRTNAISTLARVATACESHFSVRP